MPAKRAIILGLSLLLGAGTAHGQTFTFESKNDAPTAVGATAPDGNPVMGVYGTGTSTVTWADGKKTTDKYACVSMSQPPRDAIYAVHMICDGKGPGGEYSVVAGCQFQNAERTALGCSGGMLGKTGMYAGKRGGITWAGTNAASKGVGQWGN